MICHLVFALKTILLEGQKVDFNTENSQSGKISALDLKLSGSGEIFRTKIYIPPDASTNQGAGGNSEPVIEPATDPATDPAIGPARNPSRIWS